MSFLLQNFINTLPFYKTHSLSEERMGELLDPSNTEVDAAVADGRITPARRDHWLAQLNADEDGVAGVLAALPSVLPVVEVGHSDDVETADMALFARLYGAESKEA